MHNSTRLMLIAAPLALAACDAGDQSSNSSAAPTATQDMPMNENMPMMRSGDGQTANGKGTVTAVDAAAGTVTIDHGPIPGSEEHTSELQSLMRISYSGFCLKKKNSNK